MSPALAYHRWCSECRAKYARDYRKIERERFQRRIEEGFRGRVLEMFARIGDRTMSGYTAAELVRRLE